MSNETINQKPRDTGLAMVLGLLIIQQLRSGGLWTTGTIIVLVLAMSAPQIFKPLAGLWFGFSEKLGAFMSKVILALIFIMIATPVGLVARLVGSDPMRIKLWKKGSDSVFTARNHAFSKKDLQTPF